MNFKEEIRDNLRCDYITLLWKQVSNDVLDKVLDDMIILEQLHRQYFNEIYFYMRTYCEK